MVARGVLAGRFGRRQVRGDHVVPHAEPGEDVGRHVQDVRHPRGDRRVRLRRLEAAGRHGRVVVAVDQVVHDTRVIGVRGVEGLEDPGGPRRVLQGRVGGRVRGEQREGVEGRHLDIPGVLGVEPPHGLLVGQGAGGVVGPAGEAMARLAGFAPDRGSVRGRVGVVGGEGPDQTPLDVGPAADRPGALDGLAPGLLLLGGGWGPDGVPERHGDTPVRHGTARVLLPDLGEAAPRLLVEEGVKQRRRPVEARLCFRAAGRAELNGADGAEITQPGGGGVRPGTVCGRGERHGRQQRHEHRRATAHGSSSSVPKDDGVSCDHHTPRRTGGGSRDRPPR